MTIEHSHGPTPPAASPPEAGIADPLIRITTALAVASVAAVAAVISYRHAYELVITRGETGFTARLLPLPWTGSSWRPACSSSPQPPPSARSTPAAVPARQHYGHYAANLAHGLGHGPIGAPSAPGPPGPWPDPSNCS